MVAVAVLIPKLPLGSEGDPLIEIGDECPPEGEAPAEPQSERARPKHVSRIARIGSRRRARTSHLGRVVTSWLGGSLALRDMRAARPAERNARHAETRPEEIG